MKKIYMITELLACLSTGFLAASTYSESPVSASIFAAISCWLAFKGDFQE